MKTGFALSLLLIILVGCASPSKYAHDPRAAGVGPDFLDYIDQYPMDRDTQYYYPHFGLADARVLETRATDNSSSVPPNVAALMIQRPEPAPGAMENEGKGWPELQRHQFEYSEILNFQF